MKTSHSIVKTLVLSEKISGKMEKNNTYCVDVDLSANKMEIKKAVEELFKVGVVKINTLNRKGKRKRERSRSYGRTSASKRAMVTLKEGDSISIT
jgi:large subunit ribosomal protein L23